MPLVRSSAIRRVEYDPQSSVMQIWFTSGGHSYNYYGVPEGVYQALIRAPSIGRYFDTHIKDRYSFR